jgi:hypothetical protein
MRRLWMTPVLFGLSALVAGAGCNANPVLLVAYLLNDGEPKQPAEFPLKPQPKHEKDPVKVVVLTTCAPSPSAELAGLDRALAAEFIRKLQERCTENKQNVLVKKAQAIDQFKKDNPDWRNQSPYDIGKRLEADFVIDIEVQDISLYKPNTRQEFLQGQSRISVVVFNCSKTPADKDPVFSPPEYSIAYPRGGREVSKFDESVTSFRQKFIKRIAGELVMPYCDHTSDQRVMVDD